jgi:hypothetical protein
MFWFWKKKKKKKKKKENNDEYVIITRITKTSSQAQYEKEIWEKIKLQADTCPNCKSISKDYSGIPLQLGYSNTHIIHSKCTKCNTEWETEYKETW